MFRKLMTTAVFAAALFDGGGGAQAQTPPAVHNVVIVHGAFVDGSGWRDVYDLLTRDGYTVTVLQHTTRSLTDDVSLTRQAIAAADGPVILVGHSYGGVVISEAGNDPKVQGLVYIAAFVPDAGESVASILASAPPGAPTPPIAPAADGFLYVDRDRFAEAFAADVDPGKAVFMARSQLPWGPEAVGGAVTAAAWREKPSWYLVATEDRMIPPPAQQMMAERAGATIARATGSHSIYVSQPQAVADLIVQAATAGR